MGKLMDRLAKQLTTEHQQDAEDCIKIYKHIQKINNDNRVWSSQWTPLVDTIFKGFPSDERRYKPNAFGNLVLKGIKS